MLCTSCLMHSCHCRPASSDRPCICNPNLQCTRQVWWDDLLRPCQQVAQVVHGHLLQHVLLLILFDLLSLSQQVMPLFLSDDART